MREWLTAARRGAVGVQEAPYSRYKTAETLSCSAGAANVARAQLLFPRQPGTKQFSDLSPSGGNVVFEELL